MNFNLEKTMYNVTMNPRYLYIWESTKKRISGMFLKQNILWEVFLRKMKLNNDKLN
jgi:hypothetical protein